MENFELQILSPEKYVILHTIIALQYLNIENCNLKLIQYFSLVNKRRKQLQFIDSTLCRSRNETSRNHHSSLVLLFNVIP